jgi:gluconokinase/xylulokinase
MIPTLVLADEAGTPVAPAITWEDARAEPEGEALRARLDGDRLYALTGQWVDGRYLLPMFLRLARVAPRAARRARRLLGAKDWLFLRLTGVAATDPSTASGFGCYGLQAGTWLGDVVAAAGDELRAVAHAVAPTHAPPGDGSAPPGEPPPASAPLALPSLPAVLPSTATRPVAPAVAARLGLPEGLPVCVGGADSVLGCLGIGVERAGGVACIAGTSTVLLGVADRLVIDPDHRYLITPLAGVDGWGFEMDLLTTGSAFHWLAGLLGEAGGDAAALLAMAARVAPGAAGLSFLPYLAPGEQGALWDPLLSGSLFGLSLGHGAAEVARALVDGIVLETRRCLQVLEQAGLPRGPVCVAGGSAVDPDFRRHLADACRREVVYAASGGGGGGGRGPPRRRAGHGRGAHARRAAGACVGRALAAPRGGAACRARRRRRWAVAGADAHVDRVAGRATWTMSPGARDPRRRRSRPASPGA